MVKLLYLDDKTIKCFFLLIYQKNTLFYSVFFFFQFFRGVFLYNREYLDIHRILYALNEIIKFFHIELRKILKLRDLLVCVIFER